MLRPAPQLTFDPSPVSQDNKSASGPSVSRSYRYLPGVDFSNRCYLGLADKSPASNPILMFQTVESRLTPLTYFLAFSITWTIISITISRMIMYMEAMRIRVSHSRRRVRTVVKTWVPGRDAFELEEANSTAGTPNGSVSPCH